MLKVKWHRSMPPTEIGLGPSQGSRRTQKHDFRGVILWTIQFHLAASSQDALGALPMVRHACVLSPPGKPTKNLAVCRATGEPGPIHGKKGKACRGPEISRYSAI